MIQFAKYGPELLSICAVDLFLGVWFEIMNILTDPNLIAFACVRN